MYRQDSEKEKDLESFYLDMPEGKLFYPIDLEWGANDSIQSSLKISDKLSVDLQKGEKKEIEIKEIDFKKYKNRKLK